jgi:hypothetical protein
MADILTQEDLNEIFDFSNEKFKRGGWTSCCDCEDHKEKLESESFVTLLTDEEINQILKNYSKGITETDRYKISVGTKMCNICGMKTGMDTCKYYPEGIPENIYNGTDWSDSLCMKD